MLAVKPNCLPINGQLQGALPCATTYFVTRTANAALSVGLRLSRHTFGQACCRLRRKQLRQGETGGPCVLAARTHQRFLAVCNDEHTMVLCAVQLLPLVSWQGGSKHTCIACNSGAFQHWSTASQQQAQVVVTREAGKNGKLKSALQKQGISVLELPLVETGPGPDRYKTLHAWSADCSTLQTQSTKVAH